MPWDRDEPQALLRDWAERGAPRRDGLERGRRRLRARRRRGVRRLARVHDHGFDVSATAVRLARERHPGSAVDYHVADLLDLPREWLGALRPRRRDLHAAGPARPTSVPGDGRRAQPGRAGRSPPGGGVRYDGSAPLDDGPPFPQPRELFDRWPATS